MGDKREQTTLRVPTELMEKLKEKAGQRGDSFNETVIRYVRLGMQTESDREQLRKQ